MFIEALVLTACLQQKGGCSEASQAYYEYDHQAKVIVKNIEDLGTKVIGTNKWIVYIGAPIMSAATGKQADFHLYKGWSLGVNFKKEMILLQWSY